MNLSTAGIKMEEICNMVNDQFDYIHIAEFVIMPNHLHFLMVLNTEEPGFSDVHEQIKTRPLASQHHGSIEQKNEIPVDTMDTIELEMMNALDDQIKINGGFARHKNPMLNNNISCVMRWIKGRSSFEIRKFQPRFSWQARYHDKILFDKRAFQTIRNYIINNPINWHRDKLNKTK
jgi:REP element-mobilizing transposase RayT